MTSILATASPETGIPFDSFEFVQAQFTQPGVDEPVFHNLNPEDPDTVYYIPVAKSCDCTISDARRDGASWGRDRIVLRSNVAPAVVTLLLVTKRGR